MTSSSLQQWSTRELYEDSYCARGECENRISRKRSSSVCHQLSAPTFRANQVRLWFASAVYMLVYARRRVGRTGTALARVCSHTIRLRLLRIGAVVTVSVWRVKLMMSAVWAIQRDFILACHALDTGAR